VSCWLALDTATAVGSVALGEPGGVVGEIVLGSRRQASGLMPAIEQLLRHAGQRYEDLEHIVIADGPGSFTGLRIGFATAQGLIRQFDGLRLLRAPSLLSAAWIGSRFVDGPVAALYDALRGEVFAAVYGFVEHRLDVHLAPTLTSLHALCESDVRPALAVGDGADRYYADVLAWTSRPPVGPPWGGPRAAALLELVNLPGAVEIVEAPFDAEPVYGRAAAAQFRWEERHGRPLQDSGGASR
jgi:tRNA threonylcarbamoyladenosine biosynthesis protein TsaB